MTGRSKNRGEVILITIAVIGLIAACVPVAYKIYCKHKEYVKQKNMFMHSDIVAKNKTAQQMLFNLISIELDTGKHHEEFKITVDPNSEEQIPDWIEDGIKKEGRLIKPYFTDVNNNISVQCHQLSLKELDSNITYKLIGKLENLRCEFS